MFQRGPLLEYKGSSYISGVQNVSLGPTDPPRLVRFTMSSTAVWISTYPRLGPQGDSVNRIKKPKQKKIKHCLVMMLISFWQMLHCICPLVSIQWSSFRSVEPPASYVTVYYTMMDSQLLSILFFLKYNQYQIYLFLFPSLSFVIECHISLRRRVLSKIHFNLKKKNSSFVIDKFFLFTFVTRRQNMIDFIL